MKKFYKHGAFALAGVLCFGNLAHANYLNLMEGYPDIEATNLDVNYDAGSQQFTVVGDGGMGSGLDIGFLAFDPINSDMLFESYSINADIDNSGNLVGSNNTITISGYDLNGTDGAPSDTSGPPAVLLQGDLTNVGLNGPGGSVLGLQFNVTNGVFSNLFVPGNRGGINLTVVGAEDSLGNPISPTFAASFTGSEGGSYSDNFIIVPTPAAIDGGAMLLGLLGAGTYRRANKSRA